MGLTQGPCIAGGRVFAYRPIGYAPCNRDLSWSHTQNAAGFYEEIRGRTIPQGFTALVSVLNFRPRAYGVSSLAGQEPKMEILVLSRTAESGCDIGGSTKIKHSAKRSRVAT